MELEIINDEKSNKFQLRFNKSLNRAFGAFLRKLGITKSRGDARVYTVDKIPAYSGFLENLQACIKSGRDWHSVEVFPVFEETYQSISDYRFTITDIHYKENEIEKSEKYIVFQLRDDDVVDLARAYGKLKYGDKFLTVTTIGKRHIREARPLFETKKIINQSIIDALSNEKIPVTNTDNSTNDIKDKVEQETLDIVTEVKGNDKLVEVKAIKPYSELIENVLVPVAAKEPFQSGSVGVKDLEVIKSDFPHLLTKTDSDIEYLTSIELFQLSQILYPKDLDISISKVKLFQEQQKRDLKLYESLGYSTDLDYPHVSLFSDYRNVRPLRRLINSGGDKKIWWKAISEARPIANLNKGIKIIEGKISKLLLTRENYINPRTKKPKKNQGVKKVLEGIAKDIESYQISKQNILDYLERKKEGQNSPILKKDLSKTDAQIIVELRRVVQISIEKFEALVNGLNGESEHLISSTKDDLQKAIFKISDNDFKNALFEIINHYRGIASDLNLTARVRSNPVMDEIEALIFSLGDSTSISIEKEINISGHKIENVLVPKLAKEPFQSGAIDFNKSGYIQEYFPELFKIDNSNLSRASAIELFQLLQLEDPKKFGIDISYYSLRDIVNRKGAEIFKQLGFPTELNYLYVNIRLGYTSVLPLRRLISSDDIYFNWWSALANTRPIADVSKALEIIDELLTKFHVELARVLKDKTKYESELDYKDVYEKVKTDIQYLESSRQNIEDYIFFQKGNNTEESLSNENYQELGVNEVEKKSIVTINDERDTSDDVPVITSEETTNEIRHLLSEVISKLLTIESDLEGEEQAILTTTVFDLEEAQAQIDAQKFSLRLQAAIESYKDWADDLSLNTSVKATKLINSLISLLNIDTLFLIDEKKYLVIAKDIKVDEKVIPNVLVPASAKEPFQSGGIYTSERENLKRNFPELYKIRVKDLPSISGIDLFRLSQLGHPQEYGIDLSRRIVHDEITHRGATLFEEIGFPTDMIYPYVNIHTGYDSIHTLEYVIDRNGGNKWWWTALEHWRPIADISKAITIVDNQIAKLLEQQQQYINPRTKRPKTKKEYSDAYYNLEFKIKSLRTSKICLNDYMHHGFEEDNQEEVETPAPASNETYLDRVIVQMNDAYMKAERLSKKKIESLQEVTGAPSLGALWEAVELSWLLWYKRLYNLPIPFYERLLKMDLFWKKIQPTYAYSDSSKELYKQYSTPCPIGAIIAQYTGMDKAASIFEPSAGNGLLLVGAKPSITHVNEIDKSRKKSLEHQRFLKITTDNAALAFPKEMNEKYDVVVTNPPFAKWEESKEERAFIIREYFHNHRGMNHYIRLEHVMAGLALRTMKNNGKAAIITMGHLSFDETGDWKKYRPFFSWLYRHYIVDDIINMNSYKLYNKQGAVKETMLILIGGRKATPEGNLPTLKDQPQLDTMVSSFTDLWERVKGYILPSIDLIIQQLEIATKQ